MANTKTVHVAHLGGIDAGYQMPPPYDPSKSTLVLVNSFTTSSELYRGQCANKQLTDKMNLLAIELLGHGKTRTKSENFTYWDTAIMNLQVMEALRVKKAFVLGTSQGGWITVRMALLAPDKGRPDLELMLFNFRSPIDRDFDAVYSVANTKEEIKLFKSAKATDLVTMLGGAHFPSTSHPKEVDNALIQFVGKRAR